MANELEKAERTRLQKCEATIEKGMATFVEVGQALAEIKEAKLYRESHKTFDAYCKERWSMSRPRAYQLIEAAEVVDNLSTVVDKNEDDPFPPINERQARELSKIPEEKRGPVLKEASANGPLTAAKIREAAKHTEKPGCETDSVGQEIPAKLAGVFRVADDFEAKAREITAIKKWADAIENEPGAAWLHAQSFRADLSNAQNALRQNKPYAVCPYCSAKKSNCEACKGVGYVTKRMYETAPAELRM